MAFVLWMIATLIAAYVLGSRALDTGSLWQYGGTFVLVFIALHYLKRSIATRRHGKKE